MTEPKTQDLQKVVNSATDKFKSSVGAVDNPLPSSRNMQVIYDNMTKMFDAFTKGTLSKQGANSEILFRTIYRSLNDDFIKILQNSDAVDEIVKMMEKKQSGVESGDVPESMVPETTKKVVQKTLDPESYDQMQVALDFIDEIQSDILQVRLNLNREYELRKLQQAKSEQGQREDLERVNAEFTEQTQRIVDAIEGITQQQREFGDSSSAKIQELIDLFGRIGDGSPYLGELKELEKIADGINLAERNGKSSPSSSQTDSLQHIRKDLETLLGGMKNIQKRLQGIKVAKIDEEENVVDVSNSDDIGQKNIPHDEAKRNAIAEPKAENRKNVEKYRHEEKGRKDFGNRRKEDEDGRTSSNTVVARKEDEKSNTLKNTGKKQSFPNGENGTKLDTKIANPLKNPIGNDVSAAYIQNDISSSKVVENLGIIHNSLRMTMKDKKFASNFIMDYGRVQKAVGGQMNQIDKEETNLNKDVKSTIRGIKKIKSERGGRGTNLLKSLINPLGHIAVVALGGLILITLARMAIGKWKRTYMPETDGEKMVIFGFQIPGWAQMKAFAIGIRNFVVVGIPNIWTKLKRFVVKAKDRLFGKNGMFRSTAWAKYTLKRIVTALILGWSKKGMGIIFKILGFALSFIPGAGPALKFICELMPLIITFITNQIVQITGKNQVNGEMRIEKARIGQRATGKAMVEKFTREIRALSSKVFLFNGQQDAIPSLQTPRRDIKTVNAGNMYRGAIVRNMPIKYNGNHENAIAIQRDHLEKKKANIEKDYNSNSKFQNFEKRFNDMLEYVSQSSAVGLSERDPFEQEYREKFLGDIVGQIGKIDAYIGRLKQSKRFTNVQGDLYNYRTGWNPGFRVLQSDLMTAIPLNPFEEIHEKRDIPFGEPSPPEHDTIGYMPFQWFQNGARVSANPLLYEIERANAIRNIWYNLYNYGFDTVQAITTAGFQGSPGVTSYSTKSIGQFRQELKNKIGEWYATNLITTIVLKNKDQIIYGDKFKKFINNYRKGKTEHTNRAELVIGKRGQDDTEWWKESGESTSNPVLRKVGEFFVGSDRENNFKMMNQSYDQSEEIGWWKGRKKFDSERYVQNELGSMSKSGLRYRDVRYLFLVNGLIEEFIRPIIQNPIGVASKFVNELIELGVLKADGGKNVKNPLSALFNLFPGAPNWIKSGLDVDFSGQAALSQSFIEYFQFVVFPKWIQLERSISESATKKTKEAKDITKKIVDELLSLMQSSKIGKFLRQHIRFPNAKVSVIDYSNIRGRNDRLMLDKYRRELGIPTWSERKDILKRMQSGQMTDSELKFFQKAVKGLAIEAKATGDYSFYTQVAKHYVGMAKAMNAASEGDKIVEGLGELEKSKIVKPMPPRTEEEMKEDEKRRKEKERAEREKAEQERKKKLQEEAERRQKIEIELKKKQAYEMLRKQDETYETILEKMVGDPSKVTDDEMKKLGDDVDKLKQEAENRINQLPREQREVKLALIRGDKISTKTFSEMKNTAVGLHGNLQSYMEEVNKIPVGSVTEIQNVSAKNSNPVMMQDSDSVDLAS